MSLFSTFIVTVFYANQCPGSLINHGFVWYFAHLGFVEIAPRFSVSGNILFFCYDYLILIFSVLFFFSFLLASSGNVIINILFFWFWLLDYLILIIFSLVFFFFFISLGFISGSPSVMILISIFFITNEAWVLKLSSCLFETLKLICYLDVMNLFVICHLDVNVMTNKLIYLVLLKVYYLKDDCFVMLLG